MTVTARLLGLVMLVAALLMSVATPAQGRVFLGIGPVYPWPYAYYAPPPVYYPVAPLPWAITPDLPPPGWMPGRWERHYDGAGRPYDVWVPPHLR